MNQPTAITQMAGDAATTTMPRAPVRAHASVHG